MLRIQLNFWMLTSPNSSDLLVLQFCRMGKKENLKCVDIHAKKVKVKLGWDGREITSNEGNPRKKKNYQIILVGLEWYNGSNIIKLFHTTHLMQIKSMITFVASNYLMKVVIFCSVLKERRRVPIYVCLQLDDIVCNLGGLFLLIDMSPLRVQCISP